VETISDSKWKLAVIYCHESVIGYIQIPSIRASGVVEGVDVGSTSWMMEAIEYRLMNDPY
jgi:hypothetical protein